MEGIIHDINEAEFETLISHEPIVFIDFWASWCAPCKVFGEIYEEVAKKQTSIYFAKINIEKETELAEILNIRSIPHLMVFKQGIAIYSEGGSMPKSTLEELVQQAIDVDVSAIVSALHEQNDIK